MPAPTPDLVRAIVVELADRGHESKQIADITHLDKKTVRKILATRNFTGSFARNPSQVLTGRPRSIQPDDLQYLIERLKRSPNMFLDEIQADLAATRGVQVCPATISDTLKRHGITRKKVDTRAMERNEADRADFWRIVRRFYNARQFVTVDESSIDLRNTERSYGYAPSGERAARKVPFDRGQRYTIVPGMSLNGILSLHVVEGSADGDIFREFIELLLTKMNRYPEPDSVVLMDNSATHRIPETLRAIETRGMGFLFLPSYSPDFNPIELAFSKIKEGIKRDGGEMKAAMNHAKTVRPRGAVDYVDPEVLALLYGHVYSVTADDAKGWFAHCGYDV